MANSNFYIVTDEVNLCLAGSGKTNALTYLVENSENKGKKCSTLI